ncbi:DNA polymerase-3 subunit epsilon [Dyadobacter sp. BE34]|uniref:DNA polymerase-3 subunit epsilon n=1 Tax=Dyadobacter fermentans TaxID=94254 RepID=A0ABU1QSN7_9BACT|nr:MULTISPECIES: 3'-5' exonuclease [Dyadobacter]MBZ1362803.1 3'-5' exonuclease [Dyadobacter fermentans]MDR6804161.1 DNA polymerase-3 subunit epsilon [Dyadobacter fermentans]MDR7041901.1 DNA polymerase-3 subunit epsilon [Dyadobacter sp. BE242]MDR7196304.1 DNA polymerase-3 subunit epsilon [Dyadobacter sp. BE34]MDR7213151.1 DNA polymerase-3 subunit epsilon [Dyadobacter sp. BE31]
MYAIVDIETTGGGGTSRITEIAVFRHDGTRIVDFFHSLINPEMYIPPFITRLTGIDNEMVKDAPTFYDVQDAVRAMTRDAWFVAHNAKFDYGFLKREFGALDEYFQRDLLCTVQLSRKIFPGLKSYSLGNLCESLEIMIENRHRAHGDAEATVRLFEKLLLNDSQNLIPMDLYQ